MYVISFLVDNNMGPRQMINSDAYELPSTTFLAVVPANILGRMSIWTFVTAPFFENSLIDLIFSVIAVLIVGKWVSQLKWSNREFTQFIVYVNVISMVCSFFCLTFYIRTTLSIGLLRIQLNGFFAAISAFSVIAKMEIPENQIQLGLLPVAAKHLPAAGFVLSLLMSIMFRNPSHLLLSIFGIYFGWLYLRYYLVRETTIGHQTEDFTFASFFPFAVQPFINMVVTPIHSLVSRTPLLSLRGVSVPVPILPVTTTSPPSMKPLSDDAKRRIEAGNKAIDELLNPTTPK
jgi:hypothetical protein